MTELTRNLPNYFILGAAKAGTTSLYVYLNQHPDVYRPLPLNKEPRFFLVDRLYDKGLIYYVEEFYSKALGYRAIGDATPLYLVDEKVARRIKRDIPCANQRFIVILREPVSRAYSYYWQCVREGYETLSFEEAIATEEERVVRAKRDGGAWWHHAYFNGGCYASHLAVYLKYFDRSQFLILFQEDLAEADAVCRQVFEFLELDPAVKIDTSKRYNVSAMPRYRFVSRFVYGDWAIKRALRPVVPKKWRRSAGSFVYRANLKPFTYPELKPEIARMLRVRYTDEIHRLMEMTGRDLSHWLDDSKACGTPAGPSAKSGPPFAGAPHQSPL